ncbi:MAG: CoA transferase [Deltaproteobacteria bacterium]|nr:CoA transferase [Deltaproteobacteria bacterium]
MRIVDLSRLLPGPFATLCLQGLGHEVIKVEDPAGGDYLRHWPPTLALDGETHGAWFAALNRGKLSVALDLRTAAGRSGLHTLLEGADVLVESFRPGVLARLGLDPLALRDRYPRLVIASLTGWGQAGPLSALPGHDIGFLALAGMFGHAPPGVPRLQWGDLAAGGLVAALRVVDAVAWRQGAWLDIAMLDGLVGLQQTQFAQLAAGAPPDETLSGGIPIYNFYRCADGGFVSVGALEPRFMAPLAAATGGELSGEALSRLFASAPRDEWMSRLGDACVVPVLRPEEVATHPHVAGRGLFTPEGLVHPPTGPVHGKVPGLGEHQGLV